MYYKITLFEGIDNYTINKNGDIKHLKKNNNIKYLKENNYIFVLLFGRDISIKIRFDKLMALMFIKNPDPNKYKYIRHKDGNPENNKLNNLEWDEPKEDY